MSKPNTSRSMMYRTERFSLRSLSLSLDDESTLVTESTTEWFQSLGYPEGLHQDLHIPGPTIRTDQGYPDGVTYVRLHRWNCSPETWGSNWTMHVQWIAQADKRVVYMKRMPRTQNLQNKNVSIIILGVNLRGCLPIFLAKKSGLHLKNRISYLSINIKAVFKNHQKVLH